MFYFSQTTNRDRPNKGSRDGVWGLRQGSQTRRNPPRVDAAVCGSVWLQTLPLWPQSPRCLPGQCHRQPGARYEVGGFGDLFRNQNFTSMFLNIGFIPGFRAITFYIQLQGRRKKPKKLKEKKASGIMHLSKWFLAEVFPDHPQDSDMDPSDHTGDSENKSFPTAYQHYKW